MNQEEQVGLNRSDGIWIFVIFLMLLVAASGVLLWSYIDVFAVQEVNVVALVPGNTGKGDPPDLTHTGDDKWVGESSIDLFKSAYTNKKGEVVVQSANGDSVIAPGTSNTYVFSLKNTGNISMDFTMTMNSVFSLLDQGLPFEVRLRTGSEWLLGDADTWLPHEALKDLEVKNTVDAGKYINYTLEWRWPFEGDDVQDNVLASVNNAMLSDPEGDAQAISFALNINTLATITEGAVAQQSNFERWVDNYSSQLIFGGIVALIVLALLGVVGYAALHDKRYDVEEEAENEAKQQNRNNNRKH